MLSWGLGFISVVAKARTSIHDDCAAILLKHGCQRMFIRHTYSVGLSRALELKVELLTTGYWILDTGYSFYNCFLNIDPDELKAPIARFPHPPANNISMKPAIWLRNPAP